MRGAADPEPRLPGAFVTRLRRLLGPESEDVLRALDLPASTGLRVNPARMDLTRLAAATGWRLQPLPWCADAAVLDAGSDRAGRHPLHEAGAYYLQEPSATAPAAALAVRPGDRVLDLAAAPGGKATQLASALAGDGLLVANDVHPQRVRALARNLERWGARRTMITQEEPARLARRWRGAFDAVLLDAPCSGEGMFRKSAEAREAWSEGTVTACAARQSTLLDAAAALLAPGGRLVYSTCTFAPEENEAAVLALLARRPDLRPEPTRLPGLEPGRPEWAGEMADADAAALRSATARAWPHRQPGEGHFLARLRRDPEAGRSAPGGDSAGSRTTESARGTPAPPEAVRAWHAFRDATLAPGAVPEAQDDLLLRGETLWRPLGLPGASELRVLRDGLNLGRWRKGRFEPSHALAQALRADEIGRRLELRPSDPATAAYLAGAELEAPADAPDEVPDGWQVVTVLGAPLGWVRRSGPRLRNLYPKGLRRT